MENTSLEQEKYNIETLKLQLQRNLAVADDLGQDRCSNASRSTCISPVSSQGGVYSLQLLDNFALNVHRIDKDVQRCDRTYPYFTNTNLDKLRNIMCT